MPVQQTATRTLTVVILDPLGVTTAALPAGVVGQPYSVQLAAEGGAAPYSWGATGLPAGLSCSASGLISGTPTAGGSASVVVTVNDAGA